MIDICLAFKRKVLSLFDVKWLSFKGMAKTPNVTHNPLLNHSNPRVNVIEERSTKTINKKVFEVRMLMKPIFKTLLNIKFLKSQHQILRTQYQEDFTKKKSV